MRRNVRRLNREIGNHGSSLPVSTQVSLPLALPTSYQPRSLEKKIMSDIKTVVSSNTSGGPSDVGPTNLQITLNANVPLSPNTSNSSVSDAGTSSAQRLRTDRK